MNKFLHEENNKYQKLLYALVFILVFEGIMRKIAPKSIGALIFFLKDVLCLTSFYFIAKVRLVSTLKLLYTRWAAVAIALCPLLIYTAMLDLPLSIFAAKQYLLYVAAGLLVPMAFPPDSVEKFKRFSLIFAALVIPTTLVAVLQNSLPSSHWLNRSVSGESLEAFAAAGFLRVSSTFSFTGQYSWFLNAVCAFVALNFFLPYFTKAYLKWMVTLAFGISFMIGIFITGSRTSVVGSGGCLLIGFLLASWKAPSLTISRGLIAGVLLFISLILARTVRPQYFAAYDKRSSGTKDVSHEEEIQERVLDGFTSWTTWFWEQEPTAVLIGNGLGVMSNGADRVSVYAYFIRATGFWTEGDTATTAWEGGLYLLTIWYGFRLIIMAFCFNLWRKIKHGKYAVPASFLLANVIISGTIGNLGMHPPVAIWWWLSVGSIVAIQGFDSKESITKLDVGRKRSVSLQV